MLLAELTPGPSACPELSGKRRGFRSAPVTSDACSTLPFGHVSSVRPWTANRPDVVAQTHTVDNQVNNLPHIKGTFFLAVTEPAGKRRTGFPRNLMRLFFVAAWLGPAAALPFRRNVVIDV